MRKPKKTDRPRPGFGESFADIGLPIAICILFMLFLVGVGELVYP